MAAIRLDFLDGVFGVGLEIVGTGLIDARSEADFFVAAFVDLARGVVVGALRVDLGVVVGALGMDSMSMDCLAAILFDFLAEVISGAFGVALLLVETPGVETVGLGVDG